MEGLLLAGEHPDGGDPARTVERLQRIAAAGVRHFFDLTQDGEMPDYRTRLPGQVGYHSFPIPDHSLPESDEVMRAILAALAGRTQAGEAVYVHCRAGIGRTGTVAGCFLRERGLSGDVALEELNRLWLQNARSATWPSVPETAEQHEYVRLWRPAAPPAPAAPTPRAFPVRKLQLPRFRACLLGLAAGDAAAHEGKGWTDDTGMTLCVAESLLALGGFDGRDQLLRYGRWAQDPAEQGAAPDAKLRPTVQAALVRGLRSHAPGGGSHDPRLIDPAPLARTAASALFAAEYPARAMALAADVARVTHESPRVVDACRVFSLLLTAALAGADKQAILKAAGARLPVPLHEEVAGMIRLWFLPAGGRRARLPGILGSLDSAVRALMRTESFEAGLARLMEIGGPDPDAALAAYGALAGAHYGEESLPPEQGQSGSGPGDRARLEAVAEQLFRAASAR